jgi:hypothetical protein
VWDRLFSFGCNFPALAGDLAIVKLHRERTTSG